MIKFLKHTFLSEKGVPKNFAQNNLSKKDKPNNFDKKHFPKAFEVFKETFNEKFL